MRQYGPGGILIIFGFPTLSPPFNICASLLSYWLFYQSIHYLYFLIVFPLLEVVCSKFLKENTRIIISFKI